VAAEDQKFPSHFGFDFDAMVDALEDTEEGERLTMYEAALLAAVLPNPIRLKVAAPSLYVQGRAARIEQQMQNLGPAYLKDVW